MMKHNDESNNNWNNLFDSKCLESIADSEMNSIIIKTDHSRQNLSTKSAPQNIKLQVNGLSVNKMNGEEEKNYFISSNNLSVNKMVNNINSDNSLKINHDNGLSQSCLSLNQFDMPSSTQLSLDSLSSDNCIDAETHTTGVLFHQQLDKELNKVIPPSQRRKTSIETVQNLYKFNRKRDKKFNSNNLNYSPPSNCPSIYEPLISNFHQHKPSTQFDSNNLLDPSSAANKLTNKDSNSVQSIFTQQSTNLLRPPSLIGNLSTTKTDTPNSSATANRLNLMGYSNLNLKTDLTPTNLRRRCIGKNGVANIRNAKISRKSQRFFLDFFNTMIDIEWHYNLLAFTLSFVISWIFFAVIWWSIAYNHGDLYRIEELDEVAVDLDKMNMNLNFLTDNIDNLNTENVLSKTKRSIAFEDDDKILNNLAYSILRNRTIIQQLIDNFNLSKLKLNSTSGTNIYHEMNDATNITNLLSYVKNNPNLKQTFANHNLNLNKISKLVQPKRFFLNDTTSQEKSIDQNDLNQLNNKDQSINIHQTNPEFQQPFDQSSLFMNTVQTNNEKHLPQPQLPIANLTIDQRHQVENLLLNYHLFRQYFDILWLESLESLDITVPNLYYLMQLQYLLQQERNKKNLVKFLTKLAKKAHHSSVVNKPNHPPEAPPAHPLPDTSISAIEAQEEQIQKEIEARHKEKLNLNKNHPPLALDEAIGSLINVNNQTSKDQENPQINARDLPSSDAVIEEAVLKASETVLPKCGLNGTQSCRKVCLDNINSFADALLFSIETQHTIGFGTRQPRSECASVVIVLMIQSIFGCLIQCFVVGFVFAKLSRPQMRHQTLVFSKRAVINLSEYDQSCDFNTDNHVDNQFNLNFEELNDLVNLMKSDEMQEIMQDCNCTTAANSDTSSDKNNRRHSSDAISTDDLLQQNNYLPNILNLPSRKRCSNVSFLENISSLQSQSKLSNNLNNLNDLCYEINQHSIDYTGNKHYRLEFRIGDVRDRSHIISARISAYFLSKENYCFKNDLLPKSNKFKYQLFKKRRRSEVDYSNLGLNSTTTKAYNYNELLFEKKLHNFTQKKLALTIDNVEHSDGEILFIMPIVISHEINERSPLYNISRDEILNSKFEIVIVLEGTIESTGQQMQARTSYLPNEILWGERFMPVLQSDNEDAEFLVNFSLFNMTKRQNMPSFSSREYQIRKKFNKLIQFKKYLQKLSDTEINGTTDELNNIDTSTTNNLNLLRHLINRTDDKHNLNGLITNMEDLNNLNNLLNTLNKLVNNGNSPKSNGNKNGGSPFNSKNHLPPNNNQLNLVNSNANNQNNLSSLNHFYQQSLSVDQSAMNRKKSADISNLLDLLQNHTHNHTTNHIKNEHKSKSMEISGNEDGDQIDPYEHDNKRSKATIQKNDSLHITIEDDIDLSYQKKSDLKLLSLFNSTLDTQLVDCNNSNYDTSYHLSNKNLLNDQSTKKQNDQNYELNSNAIPPNLMNKLESKSQSYLPVSTMKAAPKIDYNFLNENLISKSRSDWNLKMTSANRNEFLNLK